MRSRCNRRSGSSSNRSSRGRRCRVPHRLFAGRAQLPDRSAHEHGLAGRQAGQRQPLPGGQGRQGRGRRVDVVEARRLLHQLVGGDGHPFGEGAVQALHPEHRLARPEIGHARAGHLDHAGKVAAQHRGQIEGNARPSHSLADLPVDRIDPRGGDAHQHLARARRRSRVRTEEGRFRSAIVGDLDRIHGRRCARFSAFSTTQASRRALAAPASRSIWSASTVQAVSSTRRPFGSKK